ncbi:hypothetical protein CPC08DRAFT_820645 [Agrocybe pediades]|nr:hypothetical protein CPC08DRAFT_820645 [Agrocybe pediades]
MRPLSTASSFLGVLYFASLASRVGGQSFNLVQESSGSTFFDKWDFAPNDFTFDQENNGDVFFNTIDQVNSAANGQKLAFINSNGNAVLRVDNFTSIVPENKRNSTRITSQSQFGVGSLIITDMLHIPFGCAVWPSFWTKGPNWPQDGEIDIIEGVNKNPQNQMALHATAGCMHSHITDPTLQSGIAGELNCNATGNVGCTVLETKPGSFGQSFAQNGGGVFATQFDISGIYIWFWPRANIPASIKGSDSKSPITISDFGPPSASYPNTADGCDIPKFFDAQTLVIETTLCGNWAGAVYLDNGSGCPAGPTPTSTAPGTNPTDVSKQACYMQQVVGPGSNFNDAYFEIQWLRVYSVSNTPAVTSAVSQTSVSSSIGTQASPSTSTGSQTVGNSQTAGKSPSSATQVGTPFRLVITFATLLLGVIGAN